MSFNLHEIGTLSTTQGYQLRLHPEYGPGLTGLEGFSHVMILWYAHRAPLWDGAFLTQEKPYRLAPDTLGIFSTRSPIRPNNLCVSIAAVRSVDVEQGMLELVWIDAEEGTPVLDLKPYYLCSENVTGASYPDWCDHWPKSYEASSSFDWGKEFLFSH